MKKKELIEVMSNKSGLKKKETEVALRAFIQIVESEMKQGRKVQIVGFGTFETSDSSERRGRNPHTNEVITIFAKRNPKFKAAKALKEFINE